MFLTAFERVLDVEAVCKGCFLGDGLDVPAVPKTLSKDRVEDSREIQYI